MTDKEIIINMCKQLVNGINFLDANCDGLSCEDCPFDEENNNYICCGSDNYRNYKEIAKNFLKNNGVDEMKTEKTFKEVIADIKEGEVWESNSIAYDIKTIEMYNGSIEIKRRNMDNEIFIRKETLFKLQRKQYNFTEAFAAYEEGKEIESCISGREWGLKILSFNTFTIEEIRKKWYINN